MELKKIKLNQEVECSVLLINGVKYFIFKNSTKHKYILIPNYLIIDRIDEDLIFKLKYADEKSLRMFKQFIKKFDNHYHCFGITFKKKLILKGLGFRMNLIDTNLKIEFKIGLSHLIKLDIPNSLNVKIRKNIIIVSGLDRILIGNFVSKIASLKIPDCYKGKGF
jgi:ribosomal protein L6P/L9E